MHYAFIHMRCVCRIHSHVLLYSETPFYLYTLYTLLFPYTSCALPYSYALRNYSCALLLPYVMTCTSWRGPTGPREYRGVVLIYQKKKGPYTYRVMHNKKDLDRAHDDYTHTHRLALTTHTHIDLHCTHVHCIRVEIDKL